MAEIQFGMLQTAKAREITASKAGVSGVQLGKAEDIFTEYQEYKEQLDGQSGTQGSGQGNTDYTVSPQDLEAKVNEIVEEFNQYYALINETADTGKNNNGQPNEDDKNKVPPKDFSGFIA